MRIRGSLHRHQPFIHGIDVVRHGVESARERRDVFSRGADTGGDVLELPREPLEPPRRFAFHLPRAPIDLQQLKGGLLGSPSELDVPALLVDGLDFLQVQTELHTPVYAFIVSVVPVFSVAPVPLGRPQRASKRTRERPRHAPGRGYILAVSDAPAQLGDDALLAVRHRRAVAARCRAAAREAAVRGGGRDPTRRLRVAQHRVAYERIIVVVGEGLGPSAEERLVRISSAPLGDGRVGR